MIDRRNFLGIAAGAGVSLALTPELLRALQQSGATELLGAVQQSQGQLIQRAIPSTGEMLPVIGVARGPVQNNARLAHLVDMVDPSSEAYAMLRAVVKTMVDNGGRVLDSASVAEAQQVTGMIAEDLGIRNRIFWSTGLHIPPGPQGTPPPDAAAVRSHLDAVFARLKVPTIDLMMLSASNPSLVSSLPTLLGVVREAKQEGRIRYIGVSELPIPDNPYGTLASIMRNEPIDFIGVRITTLATAAPRRRSCRSPRSGRSARWFSCRSNWAGSSSARAPHPFRNGLPTSTPAPGRSSSSSTSSVTRP